jgi:cadmium resistance protein CadD (predicted permease)
MLESLGLGIALFVATNLDDLFVLLGFFSDARYRPSHVVLGQFLGIGALTAISLAAAFAAMNVPREYVGLLGALPVGFGVQGVYRSLRRREAADDDHASAPKGAAVAAVALVTMANGGDNIAVYVSVFAVQPPARLAVFCIVFATMTALWCAGSHALVSHPRAGALIRRFGPRLLPWALIGIGVHVLVSSGAVALIGRWRT